jgi:hypothetical protein
MISEIFYEKGAYGTQVGKALDSHVRSRRFKLVIVHILSIQPKSPNRWRAHILELKVIFYCPRL